MTEKLRVYELAKEMLTDSKHVIRVLSDLGFEGKNHMSTLDQSTAQKIRDVLTGKAKTRSEKARAQKMDAPKAQPPQQPRPDVPPRPEPTRAVERTAPRQGPTTVTTRSRDRQPWLDATRPVTRSAPPKAPAARSAAGRPAGPPPRSVYLQPNLQAAGRGEPAARRGPWTPPIPGAVIGPKPYTPGPSRALPPRPRSETIVIRQPQPKARPAAQEPIGPVPEEIKKEIAPGAPPSVEAQEPAAAEIAPVTEPEKAPAGPVVRRSIGRARTASVEVQPVVETHEVSEPASAAPTPAAAAPAAPRPVAPEPAPAPVAAGPVLPTPRREPYPPGPRSREVGRPFDGGPRPQPVGSPVGPRPRFEQPGPPRPFRRDGPPSRPSGVRPDTRPTGARPDQRPFVQDRSRGPRPPFRPGGGRPQDGRPTTAAPQPAAPGARRRPADVLKPYDRRREKRESSEEGLKLSKIRKFQRKPQELRPRGTERPKEVIIEGPIMVKDLASKMAVSAVDVIKKLMTMGLLVTINQELDTDTAQLVTGEFGIPTRVKEPELSAEQKVEAQAAEQDAPEDIKSRPPVVTVMGHVDHGKTSLLDSIRQTNVAAGEAGGITQHIGASVAEANGRKIVFIDTPGHEAFTAMRARGAEVTDIVVLVVAADDGVMPQTVEAISHARAAGVPIVVALNKIDKPNATPDRVKQQLLEQGLVPEEWGGSTIVVPVSAKEKTGLDDLLEMILLVADVEELRANPSRLARGYVIESELDKGRGPVATVLVKNGTLRIGDSFVTGTTYGKVRALIDDKGRRAKQADPSMPVEVIGFEELPQAGDIFQAVDDDRIAKEISEQRAIRKRAVDMEPARRASLEELFRQAQEGEVRSLDLVVKADVQGTLEALRKGIEGVKSDEVKVSIIHEGVGGINESDIMLASASNAIILGFNVRPDLGARRVAEQEQVEIKTYRIIYDALDDLKAAMTGMQKPKIKEVTYGRAQVRQVFKVPKVGTVAGSYVTDGKALRSASVRVIRDGIVIHEGKVASLRRFKDDAREVAEGFECGIGLERFQDVKEGDVLEFFGSEEVKPE
ncbi:MAG: translation initiation factor IF-2 [Bacillota bacterium]|nr:translation initiation factor IF-2 [Bacillota bacterium]